MADRNMLKSKYESNFGIKKKTTKDITEQAHREAEAAKNDPKVTQSEVNTAISTGDKARQNYLSSIDINSYLDDYYKKATEYYDGASAAYKNKSYSTALHNSKEYTQKAQELDYMSGVIRSYLNSADNISDESKKQINTALSKNKTISDSYTQAFNTLSDYYSSFGSEEEYNTYKHNVDTREKYGNMSLAELEAEKERAEKNASKNRNPITDAKKALGLVKDDNSTNSKILYQEADGTTVTYDTLIEQKRYEEDTAKIKNNKKTSAAYTELENTQPLAEAYEEYMGASTKWQANDAVEKINKYLAANVGEGVTFKIHEDNQVVNDILDSRRAAQEVLSNAGYNWRDIAEYEKKQTQKSSTGKLITETSAYASEHPILASAEALLKSPAMVPEYVSDILGTSFRTLTGTTNPYASTNIYDNDFTNKISALNAGATQGVSSAVERITGSEKLAEFAGVAYSGVTSVAQSWAVGSVASAILGPEAGEVVTLGILSSQAAASSYVEAVNNGSTATQAFAYSIASGVFEAMFEKLSFENLGRVKGILKGNYWTTESWSQWLKGVLKTAGQTTVAGLVEGSEEVFTTIADSLADWVINGDVSEYNNNVFAYRQKGYSDSDAHKAATLDFLKGLCDDAIGGFIGGKLGGGAVGMYNTARTGIQTYRNVQQNNAIGADLVANGGVADLIEGTSDIDRTKTNGRIAKLNTKTAKAINSGNTEKAANYAGRLYAAANTEGYIEQGRSVLREGKTEALLRNVRSVFGTENKQINDIIKEISESDLDNKREFEVAAQYTGELIRVLGEAEQSQYNEYTKAQAVNNLGNTVTVDKKSPLTALAQEKYNVIPEQQKTAETGTKSEVIDTYEEETPASVTETDNQAEKKPETVTETTPEAETTETVTDSGDIMTESIMAFAERKGISKTYADTFILAAKESGLNASDYVPYLDKAYELGLSGMSWDKLPKSTFEGVKDTRALQAAFRLGANKRISNTSKSAASVKNKIAANTERNEGKTGWKNGKVTARNGVLNASVRGYGVKMSDIRAAFNDKQNIAYKTLGYISAGTGLDIVIYDSAYTNYKGVEGFSTHDDNQIWIDMSSGITENEANVGDLAKYTVLRSFTHELAHFSEVLAPAEYDELRTLVLDYINENSKDGITADYLINEKIDNYAEHKIELTYEKASREVVAEALVDIMPQSKFMDELVNEHETLAKKILAKLKEFVERIKDYFSDLSEASPETKALMNGVEYCESIVKAYDKAMKAAVKNYQAMYADKVKEKAVKETQEQTVETQAETEQTETVEKEQQYNEVEQIETERNDIETEQSTVKESTETEISTVEKAPVKEEYQPKEVIVRNKAFDKMISETKGLILSFHNKAAFISDGQFIFKISDEEYKSLNFKYNSGFDKKNYKGITVQKFSNVIDDFDKAKYTVPEADVYSVKMQDYTAYQFNLNGIPVYFKKSYLKPFEGYNFDIAYERGYYIGRVTDTNGELQGYIYAIENPQSKITAKSIFKVKTGLNENNTTSTAKVDEVKETGKPNIDTSETEKPVKEKNEYPFKVGDKFLFGWKTVYITDVYEDGADVAVHKSDGSLIRLGKFSWEKISSWDIPAEIKYNISVGDTIKTLGHREFTVEKFGDYEIYLIDKDGGGQCLLRYRTIQSLVDEDDFEIIRQNETPVETETSQEYNNTEIPEHEATEEKKAEIKRAVKIGVQTNNADAIEYALKTDQLTFEHISFKGNVVKGFNKEMRNAFAKQVIDGYYKFKGKGFHKIHVDVPYDGIFDLSNDENTVSIVLDKIGAKVEQEALFNKALDSILKKAASVGVFTGEEGTFISDGYVAYSIPSFAVDEAKNTYKAKVFERSIDTIFGGEYSQFYGQVYKASTSEGEKYLFDTGDKWFSVFKKYADLFKGTSLFYKIKNDNEVSSAFIKFSNSTGETVGYVLPIKDNTLSSFGQLTPIKNNFVVKDDKKTATTTKTTTETKQTTTKTETEKPVKETKQETSQEYNKENSKKGSVKTDDNGGIREAESKPDTDRQGVRKVSGNTEENGVQENEGGRDTEKSPSDREQETGRPDVRADTEEGIYGSGSLGDSESDVYEGTVKPDVEEAANTEVEKKSKVKPKGDNFVIGDSLNISKKPKDRFSDNVAAIRTLATIMSEGRQATSDEQTILSKYVGWGGLQNAFGKPAMNENRELVYNAVDGWEKQFDELNSLVSDGLITEEQYNSARSSTNTAYFTPVSVIKGLYEGLANIGFDGGRILEPSCGVGNFAGLIPADMAHNTKSFTMVELDSITGNIAKYLYPNNDVRIQGFEETKLPDNYMDAVIGNVPFSDISVRDKAYPASITSKIHNYFFAKTIDKTREGGIVALITSRGTLDSSNNAMREYLASKADLIGAIRLPNGVFSDEAGTGAGSDIVVFQKRAANTEYGGEKFIDTASNYIGYRYVSTNEYFETHPEMIIGKLAGLDYKNRPIYEAPENADYQNLISKAFSNIKAKYEKAKMPTNTQIVEQTEKAATKDKKEGTIRVDENGKIKKVENGVEVDVELDEKSANTLKGVLNIRDLARKLLNMQLEGRSEAEITVARKELNDFYDNFVKEYGYISDKKTKALFESDSDRYFIASLETDYVAAKGQGKKRVPAYAKKADLFTKNTVTAAIPVTKVDSIADAVILSVNLKDNVNIQYISELTGKTEAQIEKEFERSNLAFKLSDGTYEIAAKYLSGNVRAKLREAEALASIDDSYKRNVTELKKVIPKDIDYRDISVSIGSTWIPISVYEDFIADMLKVDRSRVTVGHESIAGTYQLSAPSYGVENTSVWGVQGKSFLQIFECLMNMKSVNVTYTVDKRQYIDETKTQAALAKAEEIKDKFYEFVWGEETRRNALQKEYNEVFNAYVNTKYTGENFTVYGMRAGYSLRDYQARACERIVSSGGNTFLAHTMGAGKTIMMASAAMKLKQLGVVKKPMFVVPTNKVASWGDDFLKFFPNAKVFVPDDSSFNVEGRQNSINEITNNDWDAVVVSYENFLRIPMSPEYSKKYFETQLKEAKDALIEARIGSGSSLTVKKLEEQVKKLEDKIKEISENIAKRYEGDVLFEGTGVDGLFVDEAHYYKNAEYKTGLQNVIGLGSQPKPGGKNDDMMMKVRYIQALNGGRGIVFASGTPVTNSLTEAYKFQKYLQPDLLKELDIYNLDSWIKQFADVKSELQMAPNGTNWEYHDRLSHFKNLSQLQSLMGSCFDVLMEIPNVKLPKMKGGQVEVVVCQASEEQKQGMHDIVEREKANKANRKNGDSLFAMMDYGKKIAYTRKFLQDIDRNNIGTDLEYEEDGKISRSVAEAVQLYKDTDKDKGTQLIFCELGAPNGTSIIPIHKDIKDMLVAQGIPENEIVLVGNVSKAKQKQFEDDMNSGKVRIAIGTLKKLGVGLNIQERIAGIKILGTGAVYADVDQAIARGIRNGNMYDEVEVKVYVTEGLYDTRNWDKLKFKKQFIDELWAGAEISDFEGDLDSDVSMSELLMLASGNPLIKEQAELSDEVAKLKREKTAFQNEMNRTKGNIAAKRQYLASVREAIANIKQDIEEVKKANITEKTLTITVDGKSFDDTTEAVKAMFEYAKQNAKPSVEVKVADINGYAVINKNNSSFHIDGNYRYDLSVNRGSPKKTIENILALFNNLEKLLKKAEDAEQKALSDIVTLTELTKKSFDKEELLAEKSARLDEVNKSLASNEKPPVYTENADIQYRTREDVQQTIAAGNEWAEVLPDSQTDDVQYRARKQVKYETEAPEPISAEEMEQLNNAKLVKVYRAMQVIDGKLYPPMAAVRKGVDGVKRLAYPYAVGEWQKSTERPDLIDPKTGTFKLDKGADQALGEKQTDVNAAYNPYWHTSLSPLNDQFKSAVIRPNLVIVEGYVPEFELTSGYHAEYAKDPVGKTLWKSGPVSNKLAKLGNPREVILSRYFKIGRIVPDSEAAKTIAGMLKDTGITIPFNTVTESLRNELEKQGVEISEPELQNGEIIYPDLYQKYLDSKSIEYRARNESYTTRDLLTIAATEKRYLFGKDSGIVGENDFTSEEQTALEIFKSRLDALKDLEAERRELGREYAKQQFSTGGDRVEARKTLNRMQILDNKIKEENNKLLTAEEKGVLKGVIEKTRKAFERERKAYARQQVAEAKSKMAEAAARAEYKEKIRQNVSELIKWTTRASKNNELARVPDVIKSDVIPFIKSIDFSSKRLLNGGDETKADKAFFRQLTRLERIAVKELDAEGLYNGYSNLPDDFMPTLRRFIDSFDRLNELNEGTFQINNMSAEQLKDLSKIVTNLMSYIKNLNSFLANSVYEHVYEAGDNSYKTLKNMLGAGTTNRATDFVFWEQMRPAYAFERFGEGGMSIYKSYVDGQAKLAHTTQRIIEFAQSAYTDEEIKEWSDTVIEYTMSNGETLSVPVTHLMSLYELAQQEESLKHILYAPSQGYNGKGMRIATFKRGKQVVQNEGYVLDTRTLSELLKKLTPRQKEVADKLQHFMATYGAELGNYVTLLRFGEKQMTNPRYFPIASDRLNFDVDSSTEAPKGADLYALLNKSFTKARQEEANNSIVVYNIFDVFATHLSEMAQYNAFALPTLDAVKWFNYRETMMDASGKTVETGNLRREMQRVYGRPVNKNGASEASGYAETFITNIIKAFNGTEAQGTPTDRTGLALLRRYNMAQVAYNFRVVVQQPLAIIRAATVLDSSALLKGAAVNATQLKANIEEMNEYSGIAAWKDLGFYDVNISRGVTELIKHNETKLDKIREAGMAGAEFMDKITWAAMWESAKQQIEATGKYKTGSEEYFKAVSELFDEVIYKTQVVDSVLTKNQFMRDKGFYARALGSFMSEPTTTASMVFSVVDEYNRALQSGLSKQEAFKKYGKKIAKVATVYCLSSICLAAVTGFVDAIRSDDEDKDFLERYWDEFVGNLLDELNPFTKYPIVSDFVDVVKSILAACGVDTYGNPPQTIIAQWADALTKGIEIIVNKTLGKDRNYTYYAGIFKLIQAVSGITGLPFAAATRELRNVWNVSVGQLVPSLKFRTYFSSEEKEYDIYNATMGGDDDLLNFVKKYYTTEDNYHTGVRNALKTYDSRIMEAAQARNDDNYTKYEKLVNEIVGEGNFSQADVVGAINSALSDLNGKDETENNWWENETVQHDKSMYTATELQDQIYAAYINGDTAALEKLKTNYSSEDSYNSAVRKSIRDNDSRVISAATAYISGDMETYSDALEDIYDDGVFSKDVIAKAVREEATYFNGKIKTAVNAEYSDDYDDAISELKGRGYTERFINRILEVTDKSGGDWWNEQSENEDAESAYTHNDLVAALDGGYYDTASAMLDDIIAAYEKQYPDNTDAQNKGKIKSTFTKTYKSAYMNGTQTERNAIVEKLAATGIYGRKGDTSAVLTYINRYWK